LIEDGIERKRRSLSSTDINKNAPRKALIHISTRIDNLTETKEEKKKSEMQRFIGGLTLCQDF
jgi:hypothetical protein